MFLTADNIALNQTFTLDSKNHTHASDNVSTNTKLNKVVHHLQSLEEQEDDEYEIMKVEGSKYPNYLYYI